MQNARIPMILAIIGNVVNIGLSVLFVIQFDMGVAGVAWATVISQYVTVALAILFFSLYYAKGLELPSRKAILDVPALYRFFSVNVDIFIRTVCLIFVFAFFTAQSSILGPIILAANQVVRQFQEVMAYGVDGFAFATESLVGRFRGAKDEEKLKESLKLLFYWGLGVGVFFAVTFAVAGDAFLNVFTDLKDVIEIAQYYVTWIIFISLGASVAFMLDGAFIGATASKAMRNTMLFSTFVVFLPTYYVSLPYLEDHALWFAMLMFMLGRSASMGVLAKKYLRISP